jgi:putative hydrolase of the HAD superfamily
VFSDEFGHAKPARSIFDYALTRFNCGAERAVHIGDRWETDVVGAMRAGIEPIQFGDQKPERESGVTHFSGFDGLFEYLSNRFELNSHWNGGK